jgi:hypothetical protein
MTQYDAESPCTESQAMTSRWHTRETVALAGRVVAPISGQSTHCANAQTAGHANRLSSPETETGPADRSLPHSSRIRPPRSPLSASLGCGGTQDFASLSGGAAMKTRPQSTIHNHLFGRHTQRGPNCRSRPPNESTTRGLACTAYIDHPGALMSRLRLSVARRRRRSIASLSVPSRPQAIDDNVAGTGRSRSDTDTEAII